MENPKYVVEIVEDDRAITQLIRTGLKSVPCEVVEHSSYRAFIESCASRDWQTGCLISDVYLPDGNGLEILERRESLRIPRYVPIIFITGQGDIPMAVDSMSRGAWSFLPKPLQIQSLISMVNQACEWSAQEQKQQQKLDEKRALWQTLSEQEVLVAKLMLASMPNKNIASQLDVSIRTVEARRHTIFEKLKVEGLCEFAQLATSLGIFPEQPVEPQS
jgi:FixJ family two-component response regulator